MPDLAHPWFLLAALAVPLLVWRRLRARGRALRFPEAEPLTHLPLGRARRARWGSAGLRGLALLLLAVALAGPRWPDLRTPLTTEGIAIVLVVDVSGSMAEPDFAWQDERLSRLDAVRRVLHLFVAGGVAPDGTALEGRPNDLVGLVTFATRPESLCPLTLSHSALLRLLDAAQPRSLPTESQTNIGDALAWGLHRLEAAGPRRKVLVLLSDGDHNVPPPALKPRQAAQLAAQLHVPVYTIFAGGSSGSAAEAREAPTTSPGNGERPDGEKTLQTVAQLTGGQFFQAGDTEALLAACRRIDRLERQEIESFQYRRYHEAYPWFALAALGCLTLAFSLEWTVWRRLP